MSTQITISPEIKLVVNTTPITGGSAGQILFQTTGNTVGESANLSWDNTNARLRVTGPILAGQNGFCSLSNGISSYGAVGSNYYYDLGTNVARRWASDNTAQIDFGVGFRFRVAGGGSSGSIISWNDLGYWSATTGNLLVGTSTDAGFRLDVNGSFRASDGLIASSSGGGAYKLTVQQTGVGQGNTFRVIQLGYSMIDVNTSGVSFMPFPSPSGTVGITNWTSTGGQTTTFFTKNSEFTPQGGPQAIPLIKFPNPSAPIVMGATATVDLRAYLTVSGSFNATSGLGAGQSLLPSLTATANNDTLVGLDINPTFTNGAFTGVKNLSIRVGNSYAQYTSALGHGVELNTSVGILGSLDLGGDSSILYLWRSGARTNGAVIGSTYVSPNFGHIYFGTTASKQMILSNATGNLLINTTTDAGYKLDVNGSVRTGALKVGGQLDTAATGSGHVFARLNDNGTLIRIFNWSYGNSSGNTWVGGSEVASALFALNSTSTGFLPPRMTTTEKNAIATPAAGLMVYDNTLNRPCFYNGTSWITL